MENQFIYYVLHCYSNLSLSNLNNLLHGNNFKNMFYVNVLLNAMPVILF